MVTDFIVVRHGQTSANLRDIVQGQLDIDLDELGKKQGQCLANRLRHESFDHIFASDLRRSKQTAEMIAAGRQVKVEVLKELREWNLGKLQGCTKDEIKKSNPEILDAFSFEKDEVIVPGGESHRAFYQRVSQCMEDLSNTFSGKKLLLVVHAGVLHAIYRHIAGRIDSSAMLPTTSNASYSHFLKHDSCWQMVCWNDVSHLREVGVRHSLTF